MQNKKIKAFTLVELIVVITILAILGTIAFISLSGYSADARDSTRLSDMSSMKSSLELFNLESWRYPIPSNETAIIYSGATAWSQWTFGDTVYANVSKLDKVPKDPSTDKEYVYSTTWPRNEYQLAWALEGEILSYLNPSQASLKLGKEKLQVEAATKTAKLKLSWSYNGKVLKVSSWATTYILAMPSIMTTTWSTVDTIVNNNYLAYDGYKNLPYQYSGSYNTNPETNLNLVNSGSLLVFSGDISVLSDSTSTWVTARQQLIQKLQLAYTGTSLVNVWEISQVLNTNTSDSVATEYVSTYLVKNDLGGSVKVSTASNTANVVTYNCDTQPTYSNATYTAGTATSSGQTWQNSNSWNACYYTCNSGYVWNGTSCAKTCQSLLTAWNTSSGTYTVDPDWDWSDVPFTAYCDMSSNWWGWMLLAAYPLAWSANPATNAFPTWPSQSTNSYAYTWSAWKTKDVYEVITRWSNDDIVLYWTWKTFDANWNLWFSDWTKDISIAWNPTNNGSVLARYYFATLYYTNWWVPLTHSCWSGPAAIHLSNQWTQTSANWAGWWPYSTPNSSYRCWSAYSVGAYKLLVYVK